MPAAIPDSTSWAPVRVALTAGGTNPTTIANGSIVNGVTLATGDRFVCVGARADAGIYTVGASNSSRATDANEAAEFFVGRTVRVLEGSEANVGVWALLTQGAITLGTTTLTISYLGAEAITIPGGTYDNTAAAAITIPGSTYDNTPAVPISMATSTTIYYGSAAQATLTEAQAKSSLLNTIQASVAGNYVCPAGEYKYLIVPASMTAPTAIRDLASGWGVQLAGTADGYANTTSNLTHASLSIDGINYRVYRSANKLGAAVTLQVL